MRFEALSVGSIVQFLLLRALVECCKDLVNVRV